jgi:hypothetical protein
MDDELVAIGAEWKYRQHSQHDSFVLVGIVDGRASFGGGFASVIMYLV